MRLDFIFLRTVCFVFVIFFMFNPAAFSSLQEELDRLFASGNHTDWSVCVETLGEGKLVYSLAPDKLLMPASNMKIPSCAAILLTLGPDFSYETALYTDGSQTGDLLQGNLIIVGSGDPSIGGRFHDGDITHTFREWAGKLKEKNIRRIQGDILGVDAVFDENRRGLNWNPVDFVEWYAAEISALSLNDACIDARISGKSQNGKNATITLNPNTRYIQVINQVTLAKSRKSERGVVIQREPDSIELTLTGSVATTSQPTVYASIPNPTLYFVTVLKETLEKEGIEVTGKPIDGDHLTLPPDETWNVLHRHTSPPLRELVDVCLKNSQNLYAEHFVKTLGYRLYGHGSFESGTLAIKDMFYNQGCIIDKAFIADGSGLSRDNLMSSKDFVKILQTMSRSQSANLFRDALPLAGINGTLKSRMRGTPAYQRVRAKTGSMKGISALSGYLDTQKGQTLAFSILGNSERNGIRLSSIIDDACALLVSYGQ